MSKLPDYRIDSHWIRSLRGEKSPVDTCLPNGWFNEKERSLAGVVNEVAAILLTNRECPYSCLMCDLWKHTTDKPVPAGAIPAQLEYALARLAPASSLKLFNSGSFFDPGAIPVADYPRIASLAATFEHILVESHPAFIGEQCLEFSRMLGGRLEVAIGLESVHPAVQSRLNKRMSLEDFRERIDYLKGNEISTRAFILLRPPFLSEEEGLEWACRSIDYAFACGVDICSVIPVRSGNGALDHLETEGYFSQPGIHSLEQVLEYGIGLEKGLVFADLWDLERFDQCESCFAFRRDRLAQMNLHQEILPGINCACSG